MHIKGDGRNSLDLVRFLFEDFEKEFAALKENTEEKDFRISDLETRSGSMKNFTKVVGKPEYNAKSRRRRVHIGHPRKVISQKK